MLSLGWSSPLRESWTPDDFEEQVEQDQEPTITLVVPSKAPMWVLSDWTADDDEEDELEPIAAVEEFWAAKAK